MNPFAKFYSQFWHTLPVRRRGTIIIAIPVTSLFVSLGIFVWFKSSLIEDEIWVRRTQQIRLETKQLLSAFSDAETNMQSYGLTGRSEFLESYEIAVEGIPETLEKLERLARDNLHLQKQLVKVEELMEQSLGLMSQKIGFQDLNQSNGSEELVISTALLYDWLEEGKTTIETTRNQIQELTETAEQVSARRKQHQNYFRQLTWAIFTLSAVLGIASGLLAIYLFRQLARELTKNQQKLKQKNLQLQEREQSLLETNQRLEQVCDRLQRFTANASHELRTPLATILSNAQLGLITAADDPEFLCQRLEKIVEKSKSMSTLVKELLFLARCETELPIEKFQPTNLVELLKNLTPEWTERAKNQDLQLKAQLPERSLIVMADPNLICQVVINLLSNACRYTPAGGIVQLRLSPQGDRATIEVEDNGVGISAENLPHIFERFYRVYPSPSRIKGGSGLGLAIAEQIIRAHRGTISVSSILGQGTTFRIVLPGKG
ncbi:sensor histidine kinase [Myxosarcina sp. GI1(2024)]